MGQRIAQLYKFLQDCGIGGVTRILSSKAETEL